VLKSAKKVCSPLAIGEVLSILGLACEIFHKPTFID